MAASTSPAIIFVTTLVAFDSSDIGFDLTVPSAARAASAATPHGT